MGFSFWCSSSSPELELLDELVEERRVRVELLDVDELSERPMVGKLGRLGKFGTLKTLVPCGAVGPSWPVI